MRLVLVGLGRIAWKGFGKPGIGTHLDAILPNGAFELVGGVDPDGAARDAFRARTGVVCAPDLKTGLEALNPEAVVICSPMQHHAEQAIQALGYGSVLGVLIEKPMATTVAECQAILDARGDKTVAVAHQRRFCPRHLDALAFIQGGGIGNIEAARAWFPGDHLNNGTHAADLCRMMVTDSVPWHLDRVEGNFGISIRGDQGLLILESYGSETSAAMRDMYLDFADCCQHPTQNPICSAEDGLEAVRHALFAAERDHAA